MGQPYTALLQNGTAHQHSALRIYQQQAATEQQAPPAAPAPLQPSVQINIQPLIKPVLPTSRAAPIVYSFGQTDYANKLFPKGGGDRRVSWGKVDALEGQDDFADILG